MRRSGELWGYCGYKDIRGPDIRGSLEANAGVATRIQGYGGDEILPI